MGISRRLLQVDELEENLAALGPWNLREFEIPDVIGFADFVHSRGPVAESLFASQRVLIWDRALRFPYPNGPKLRELVVLEPLDLLGRLLDLGANALHAAYGGANRVESFVGVLAGLCGHIG